MVRKLPRIRLALTFLPALVVLAACGASSAMAAEPGDLVVLLHPKMKDWEKLLAKNMFANDSGWWGIRGYRPKGKTLFPACGVRLEVGLSAKDLKDWSMMVQFDAPRAGRTPGGGPGVIVPFVVRYRESADAKPVEVTRGTVWDSGDDYAQAVANLCGSGSGIRVWQSLSLSEAGRVFADKPRVEYVSGSLEPFVPTKIDLKADPPTVSVNLHNRLPVPVAVMIEFQNKFKLADGDQIFRMKDDKGQYKEMILEAGEKKTVTFGPKDVNKGQEPRWCKLTGVSLLNRIDEVKK